jgi:hypothetical protein
MEEDTLQVMGVSIGVATVVVMVVERKEIKVARG